MFSPRYWTVTLCALLCGLITRRGAFLVRVNWSQARARVAAITLGAAALLPLLIGLHLPAPTKPSLTIVMPTLYPTADRLQPMGAVVPFLWRMQTAPARAIDHNQSTWLAARSARYELDESGRVPVLDFSLRAYVQLACALQGLPTQIVERDAPFFYSDARDLLRTYATPDRLRPDSNLATATELAVSTSGVAVNGYRIVAARRGASDAVWREQLALSRVPG
jgi:hypothetical protein